MPTGTFQHVSINEQRAKWSGEVSLLAKGTPGLRSNLIAVSKRPFLVPLLKFNKAHKIEIVFSIGSNYAYNFDKFKPQYEITEAKYADIDAAKMVYTRIYFENNRLIVNKSEQEVDEFLDEHGVSAFSAAADDPEWSSILKELPRKNTEFKDNKGDITTSTKDATEFTPDELELVAELFIYGVQPYAAKQIIVKYKNSGGIQELEKVIGSNPYSLAEAQGISFVAADCVARYRYGVLNDLDAQRMSYYVPTVLSMLTTAQGHTYARMPEPPQKDYPYDDPDFRKETCKWLYHVSQYTTDYRRVFRSVEQAIAARTTTNDVSLLDSEQCFELAIDTVNGEQCIFNARIHKAELGIAAGLYARLGTVRNVSPLDKTFKKKSRSDDTSVTLSNEQYAAGQNVLSDRVTAMQGPAGSGKTLLSGAIGRALQVDGKFGLYVASTGAAGDRLKSSIADEGLSELSSPSDYCGTIHRSYYKTYSRLSREEQGDARTGNRASNWDAPGTWRNDDDDDEQDSEDNSKDKQSYYPIEHLEKAEALTFDESSLLPLEIVAASLQQIPMNCEINFVGDYQQLPPVGPGQFFKDIVESEVVPTVRLSQVKRTNVGSEIPQIAADIMEGKMPPDKAKGFTFVEVNKPEETNARLKAVLKNLLVNKSFAPSDVMVVPLSRTTSSYGSVKGYSAVDINRGYYTGNVNSDGTPEYVEGVREFFTGSSTSYRQQKWELGDRVIQLKNNYDHNIFNGNLGTIQLTDEVDEEGNVTDHVLTFSLTSEPPTSEQELAFAVNTHRCQGAEWRIAIVVLPPVGSRNLYQNMLYTAITRAVQHCIVIGTRAALHEAVTKPAPARRTALKYFLQRIHNSSASTDSDYLDEESLDDILASLED